MATCQEIEEQLAAYVDGESDAAQCAVIDAHLERCPECRARLVAQRTTHELLATRQARLRGSAPDNLRRRCAAQRVVASGRSRLIPQTIVRLSLAATIVLAAGVFMLFGWGSSVETYAAQLAVDHVKCTQFTPDSGLPDPIAFGRNWEAANGWPLRITPVEQEDRPTLVGIRRCGSTKGRVAHIFYQWRGQPVSVYVLNDRLEGSPDAAHGHGHASIVKLGERALIWSNKARTYAVVAEERTPDLEQVAAYVQRTIE